MMEPQKVHGEHGTPLETQVRIKLEGSGQMGQIMAQKGSTTTTVKVIAISTDPISDDVFRVPAGYTKQ
jgi:predicted homoserine dehydrogenase-like protein